jgi:hypothetical protein
MSEDLRRQLRDRPDLVEELIRLFRAMLADLAELRQIIETRLPDTRPILEKPQADITQLHQP